MGTEGQSQNELSLSHGFWANFHTQVWLAPVPLFILPHSTASHGLLEIESGNPGTHDLTAQHTIKDLKLDISGPGRTSPSSLGWDACKCPEDTQLLQLQVSPKKKRQDTPAGSTPHSRGNEFEAKSNGVSSPGFHSAWQTLRQWRELPGSSQALLSRFER